MSRDDIQSWLSASGREEDDDTSVIKWSKQAQEDWPAVVDYAARHILASSTKLRIELLEDRLMPLVDKEELSISQLTDVFYLLTLTYPRYVDSKSRKAAERTLQVLVKHKTSVQAGSEGKDGELTQAICQWMATESARIGRHGPLSGSAAPGNHFVLLNWACVLYETLTKTDISSTSTQGLGILVGIIADMLDCLLDTKTRVKGSIRKAATIRVRRALRMHPKNIPNIMSILLSKAKSLATPFSVAPILGVSLGVTIKLKDNKDEASQEEKGHIDHLKDEILDYYVTYILCSKIEVPAYISAALGDFISHFTSEEDATTKVIPASEKVLLRSPEISMNVIADFLRAYPRPLTRVIFLHILNPVLSCAKSTNVIVRSRASHLFSTLINREGTDEDLRRLAVDELLSLPKAGKTVSADHRICLYSMLRALRPIWRLSSIVTFSLPSLLVKETSDVATSLLANTLASHVKFLLKENEALDSNLINTVVREMTSSKPALRRGSCVMAGNALWDLDVSTDAARTFAVALLPTLELNLKTVTASPLSSVASPLEGYVALATLIRSVSRLNIPNFDDILTRNTSIQGIVVSSTKPHFLLWQKCYQKLGSAEEETWFFRALQAVLMHFEEHFIRTETLRVQMGLALIHLVDSENIDTRRAVLTFLRETTIHLPELASWIFRDTLLHLLSRYETLPKSTAKEMKEESTSQSSPFYALLYASTPSTEDVDLHLRERILAEALVLAHHPAICGASRDVWIELCQKARVDPAHLIVQETDRIMQIIWESVDSKNPAPFITAGFRAITTLTFVAPDTILPRLMEQLRQDLDSEQVRSIGFTEYGIWKTVDGTLFVDVLAKKKEYHLAKGKDSELRRWDDELRKSLAAKKPAITNTMTKQDKALVDAQLAKESRIRSHVDLVKCRLDRGLRLIRSIVAAKTSNFHSIVSSLSSLLLSGVVVCGGMLISNDAFETYVTISEACSERLGNFRQWIGIATLRSVGADMIPEELTFEPLNQLVLRVLYRLRSQAEQSPFDLATYSYAAPLLAHIITSSGKIAANADEVVEQLALVVDIIRFHCSKFVDPAYPRLDTITGLQQIIRHHPQMVQAAIPTLVDLGEAIQLTSNRDEIQALILGTLSEESFLRNACLQTLQAFDLTDLDWSPELWLACHDDDDQNSRLARHIWEDNGLDTPENYLEDMLQYQEHGNMYVRLSSSYAFADAAEMWPQTVGDTLISLKNFYREKAKVLVAEYDEYGIVIPETLDRTDPWPARLAVARTFEALAPFFSTNEVVPFFQFLVGDEALGDCHGEVRRGFLVAGTAVLDLQGASFLRELISLFEKSLKSTNVSSEVGDHIQEAVVILLGRLARHLDATDTRIPEVVGRLIDSLKTPAESVQIAVSDCLAPLIAPMKSNAPQLIDQLFTDMTSAPKYAARRGAAYGVAGIIKGTGISGIKEFDIIGRLQLALEDKKNLESRQGAMFALETLSATLGRLFEPYVPRLVPSLLSSFGDAAPDVRDATQDAAKVIMAKMSAYGVKLLLPLLLSGLEEKQWRTKKGSIELLGTMAFCAPAQLSLSLPTVIPRLTGVLSDSHAQVRAAANKSLKQFGEVINNPEIQSLVPVLLKALVDPERGASALTSLLNMSFAHYIDSSSLALVIPIIERGLRERSSETKQKAARIVGNMASLTDSKDFVPYLSRLLPMVHICLGDPVPEARATAARSLGTLVERLGEAHFPDLVPGLLRTLKTDTSGIDRQGAAQGLSEVLAGLGMERFEGLLPDIITNASSPRSYVKEGFMSLLVYLPATFGVRFQPHLPKIIQPILGGLADSEEVVRDAALRAGRMIIANYADKAVDLLLPELENGMFDSSWRIRQSSVMLVGELFFKLAGISGKAEIEEENVEEATAGETSRKVLTEVLGQDRRDRVLSSLYLARQDGVSVVRQSSIHVWKALVQNTPRTVREILPSITAQVISLLASSGFEQQETAARTIGELCRKFGEKILAEILTILRRCSTSNDDRTREGTCLALSEILENTSDSQKEGHEDEFIAMVRRSLVDDSANVRSAAARSFDMLQETLGARAIDETIPTLLQALRQPGASSGTALQALKEVMIVRANVVFPILVPTLIATPITAFNAQALARLVPVAGNSLSKRLTIILESLVPAVESEQDGSLRDDINEAIRVILASISDAEGLNTLMLLLLGWAKHQLPSRRISSMNLFATFCEETDLDISFYRVDWIRQLIGLLDDRQLDVVESCWKALDVFVKTISKEDLESLVVPLRRTIEATGAPGRHVPGFSLPKGLSPLVPVILAGLTMGSNEQREQAAYAIGDLVERTGEEAMKPFVVPLTGPLIRVATQSTNLPPPVKSAILTALTTMLDTIPQFVKPFFPQLQRTFIKATSDSSSLAVRSRAALGLGSLMRSQPRVDPVVTELISGAKSSEDAIAASFVLSLARVVKAGFANLGQASKEAAVELIDDAFRHDHDEHYNQAIAALFANLSPNPELLQPIVNARLLAGTPTNALSSNICKTAVEEAPELFYTLSCAPSIVKKVISNVAENPSISRPARETKELFKTMSPYVDDDDVQSLLR